MKKLVYISHPYGGNIENAKNIENIVKKIYESDRIYAEYCIVSPVHAFGFMYDAMDYDKGIGICLDMLGKCDLMLVFGNWESSRGCNKEIRYCKDNNIPYMILKPLNIMEYLSTDTLYDAMHTKLALDGKEKD